MTLLVERPVDGLCPASRWVLLDLRRRPEVGGDERSQVIGVVGGVGDDVADAVEPLEQFARLRAVAPVPGRDLEAQRQPERVNGHVDLGGQPAPRPSDRESFKPPF